MGVAGAVEGLVHRRVAVGHFVLGVEPENLAERVAEQVHDVHEAQPAPHVDGEGPLEEDTEVSKHIGLIEQSGV